MKVGDKIKDGWEVVDEMFSKTGMGYVVARPYSNKKWADLGVKEYGIVTEGVFRISFDDQRKLIKLILENIKGEPYFSFDPEKALFQETLDKVKFTGKGY